MNEFLFILQTFTIILFAIVALRLGAEALTSWVAIQALIANLFVLKQIHLFGLQVTASDAFVIGSLLGLNFLQEYFGKDMAKKASWICFFFMSFFVLVSKIHLLYEPSYFDSSQTAFLTLLSPSSRLLIASMSVFFIVQQFDVRFFNFLKNFLPNASFAMRSFVALMVSQFLDTTLFSFAGLYGIVASMLDIIVLSYLIKILVISCFTVFLKVANYERISL